MASIYLVTLIHTATHACFTGSKVVIALLALELGAPQTTIGMLIAAYAVAPLIFGVYSGRLADRIGMRIPMLAGATAIGCAMLVGFLWQTLPALFVTALLVGVGFVFFIVSVQNLVGAMPGTRARNYSILTIGYSVSNLIGPLLAGYVIDYAGHAHAFLMFAIFSLLPICVLATRADLTRVERSAAVKSAPDDKRSAFDLLKNPVLRRQILITGLLMSAWELFLFYVPIYGHGVGLSASTIGVVIACFAAATFLIRFALPGITGRYGVERVLVAAMVLAAVASAIFPMFSHASALMLVAFVLGLGLGCGQPLSLTTSFERSPPGRSGEVAGLRTIATNAARMIVPLLSGAFGAALGPGAVFWLNAVNLAAVSYMARHMDRGD
jgi:MFS family permease